MEHRPIQQLSASLVNRIAAGEVIERPASVVKELVENALDAGATSIVVEIEDGGRELIRVIDNGSGIPPAELPLAFAEHATSKLSCDEDLFQIATMGFRGEALASIGAVSHARILSRTAESDAAYEIFNRGGAISDAQAAAGNVGTTVEVRNLFFNTPARRKFLKGAPTEFGHISETLLRLALPYPQASFKLSHNGRLSMELPAGAAQARLLAGWPDEFHDQHLAIEGRNAELRIHGIVGLPALARPTAKYQYIYLNGRHIRDRFIQHAAREAYRGLTEPGRHPAIILMLEVPPGDVDVNVHPTKVEVRFKDGGRVHSLVMSAIRERLLGSDLTPAASPIRTAGAREEEPPYEDMRQKLADFFKRQPGEPTGAPAADGGSGADAAGASGGVGETEPGWTIRTPTFVESGAEGAGRGGETTAQPAAAPPPPAAVEAPPRLIEPMPNAVGSRAALAGGSAIQLHNSYLVAQTAEGMIIIDQHALHERIIYEELRARLMRGPLESQRLLIPQTVGASPRQIALLEQIQPMLQRLGIEAFAFGPDVVAVQAFPSFLDRLDPCQFMRELLERGEQELLDLHEEELLHELLDMMACKAAVKAGDPLTAGEIEALLARRELVERSSNCPHGRPTTLRLTLKDLEKQFKRTGF